MCQLWGHVHAAVEEGRHGALPLQRLRALPQDERHQPAPVQTPEEAGKSRAHSGVRRRQRNLSQGCFNSICPAFKTSLVFSCLGRSKTLYCPVLQTLSQAVQGAVGHGVILGFVVSVQQKPIFASVSLQVYLEEFWQLFPVPAQCQLIFSYPPGHCWVSPSLRGDFSGYCFWILCSQICGVR